MSNKIVIGSRESKLAVLQSQMVQDFIVQNHPDMEVDILTMKTTGDKILDRTLDKIGGKGLFVKELDRALLEGRSQLSVHSLKDMPMEESEELPILAFSKREDVRDVLVLPRGCEELDASKPIGCSSLRRKLQLQGVSGDVFLCLPCLRTPCGRCDDPAMEAYRFCPEGVAEDHDQDKQTPHAPRRTRP